MKISTRILINGITVLLTYLLIIIFLFTITKVEAQKLPKQKLYQLKVRRVDGSTVKGYLHSIEDDGIHLTEDLHISRPFNVAVNDIKAINARKKDGAWKGLVIGAGTGALLGYIIGYASYEKPECSTFCLDFGPEEDGLAGMSLGMLVGGAMGAIAGGSSKTFNINGNQNSFELIKPDIAKYQVIYDPLTHVK